MSGSDPAQVPPPAPQQSSGWGLSDPFNFNPPGQQEAPGAFGITPSAWQHLAMFGGNMLAAANARTPSGHLAYGTGLAGPLGAATVNTMQQAQDQAIGRQRMQSGYLQNQLRAAQLPVEIQRAKFQQAMMASPEFRNSILGIDPAQQQPQPEAPASYAAPAFGALEGAAHKMESGGSMRPGIIGDGGKAFGPMQVHAPALADVNAANGTSYTPEQLAANPALGKWAGDEYLRLQVSRFGPRNGLAAYNAGPGAVQQAQQGGAPIPASTQGYVQRGMALAGQPQQGGAGDAYMAQADQAERQADILARQQAAGQFAGVPMRAGDPAALRQKAQQLRQVGLQLNSAGGIKSQEANATNASALAYQPQIAGAEANAKNQSALRYEPQIAGAKAAATLPYQQAEQGFRQNVDGTLAPIQGGKADPAYEAQLQAGKSGASNLDVRPGGMVRTVDAAGKVTWVKNPQLEPVAGPDGTITYSHVSPAMPNAPPGTPGTSEPVLGPDGQPAVKALPPNITAARDKAYTDFAGKDTDTYISSKNMQGALAQMGEAANTLNKNGGFLGSGPTSAARIGFAAHVNDVLRTAGLPEAFDPNAVGAWEELTKATTTAGFELSSHYEGHAKQAAQTIASATSAIAGQRNSPLGFQRVFAGLNEIAQYQVDLHEIKQPVYDQKGDIVNAETSFAKQFPAQMYSRRAISTVTPYPIENDEQLNRYLPGTRVTYKGHLVTVPQRPGAPPIPDYILERTQTQPGPAVKPQ